MPAFSGFLLFPRLETPVPCEGNACSLPRKFPFPREETLVPCRGNACPLMRKPTAIAGHSRPPEGRRKSKMFEKDLIDRIEIVFHQIIEGGYQLPQPRVRFMKINRNIQRIIFRKNRGLVHPRKQDGSSRNL